MIKLYLNYLHIRKILIIEYRTSLIDQPNTRYPD